APGHVPKTPPRARHRRSAPLSNLFRSVLQSVRVWPVQFHPPTKKILNVRATLASPPPPHAAQFPPSATIPRVATSPSPAPPPDAFHSAETASAAAHTRY